MRAAGLRNRICRFAGQVSRRPPALVAKDRSIFHSMRRLGKNRGSGDELRAQTTFPACGGSKIAFAGCVRKAGGGVRPRPGAAGTMTGGSDFASKKGDSKSR